MNHQHLVLHVLAPEACARHVLQTAHGVHSRWLFIIGLENSSQSPPVRVTRRRWGWANAAGLASRAPRKRRGFGDGLWKICRLRSRTLLFFRPGSQCSWKRYLISAPLAAPKPRPPMTKRISWGPPLGECNWPEPPETPAEHAERQGVSLLQLMEEQNFYQIMDLIYFWT